MFDLYIIHPKRIYIYKGIIHIYAITLLYTGQICPSFQLRPVQAAYHSIRVSAALDDFF